MAQISGTETKPEIFVRKQLFNSGFRYRKNVQFLPGKPDIVLKKFKTVIFVNGCLWHGHKNCSKAKLPKTNRDFWKEKISKNIERDILNLSKLQSLGWNVITIWGCEIKNPVLAKDKIEKVIKSIKANLD